MGWQRLLSQDELLRTLDQIRQEGCAVNEEMFAGIRCIAAPVFDFSGLPLHSLSLAGPVSRITDDRIKRIKEDLNRVCGKLTERLGGQGNARSSQASVRVNKGWNIRRKK